MAQTSDNLARKYGITRQAQDEFALMSHQRAVAARDRLREEIVPMFPVPDYGIVADDGRISTSRTGMPARGE